MAVDRLNHVNIWTSRLADTVAFYEHALGLHAGFRPPQIAIPGAWIYDQAGVAVIHLMDAVAGGMAPASGGGAIDHIAFECTDFDAQAEQLRQLGLSFRTNDIPGMPIRQIFVDDPNGITIELNFNG